MSSGSSTPGRPAWVRFFDMGVCAVAQLVALLGARRVTAFAMTFTGCVVDPKSSAERPA